MAKTLSEWQKEIDAYISQFKEGYFSPMSMVARLAEEVGEIAREVNHRYGEKPKKSDERPGSLSEELGDLLFVIVTFANAQNIDLDQALHDVMEKYQTRDKDRWTRRA
ncbi:MAG: nucleotide pyrophosphohydrolase [Candidatus Carbobacillus sp.]|nr:nucleotide pyrophosphohydrolase [Candidatus Carbobacillus sp.]